jgi:hypothetical protein
MTSRGKNKESIAAIANRILIPAEKAMGAKGIEIA